jgi:SPOR domain
MAPGGGFSYLVGPTAAFVVVGLLALLLRWSFARGGSLVAPPAQSSTPDDYGLLVSVATVDDPALAESLGAQLEGLGIRSTVVETSNGLRVMVFPADLERARAAISRANPDRSDPGQARE